MAFTYFFRDMPTLELIVSRITEECKDKRQINIWDAGCANGAEPYTLAMLLSEKMGQFAFRKIRISATDLNPQFDEIIKNGVYSAEELGRIPKDIMQTYFSAGPTPETSVLDDSIRRRVSFQHHDLTTLKPVGGDFSVIICKNVLLHLSPAQRVDVLKMFHDSLCPGGYLGVEQTQKMPAEASDWFTPVQGAGPVFQRS